MNNEELFPIIVPLKKEAHKLAQKFASEQTTPDKRQHVYRNTLAVWAVNYFLQWMEIDTDLSQGESWNPIIRSFNDVADLLIPSLGRLECRPIFPGEKSIYLPSEVQENRIGCVVVLVGEKLNQAQLVGCFIPNKSQELPNHLKIQELCSLDALLNHLDFLEMVQTTGGLTRLRKILEGLIESGWQKDEESYLISSVNSKFSFRSISGSKTTSLDNLETINYWIDQLHSDDELCRQEAAQRLGQIGTANLEAIAALTELLEYAQNEDTRWQAALSLGKLSPNHPKAGVRLMKQIELGADHLVTLVISCRPNDDGSIRVQVQVYPVEPQIFVPTGCKLAILDESEEVFVEIEAQDKDDYIKKFFDVASGDRFAVKVGLCYSNHIQHFFC